MWMFADYEELQQQSV